MIIVKILLFVSISFSEVFDGYTLYTVGPTYETFLIDNDYNVVNSWSIDVKPASMPYLMPDSTLIYPCRQDNLVLSPTAAAGGRIIRCDWDGNVIWDWTCSSQYQLHHDIEPTDDGTILAIAQEDIDGFRPDVVLEILPVGSDDAEIVWTWRVFDHMSNDLYNPYTFYSEVGLETPSISDSDWNHFNAISLNDSNEILLCSRNWNEIYVIGRGGDSDILYRWGNPFNYGRGDRSDQILNAPHGVNQIRDNFLGGGNIILFNNNALPQGQIGSSQALEITPPSNYEIDSSEPFGPSEPSVVIEDNFYSPKQSGAYKLKNGNTFVSVSLSGRMIEFSPEGEIVWEHQANGIFRSQKYGRNYLVALGDANLDGIINILDVILVTNCIINDGGCDLEIIDANKDHVVDILDIVILINKILSY